MTVNQGHFAGRHEPWNKGKPGGQTAPFKLKDIWATGMLTVERVYLGTLPHMR